MTSEGVNVMDRLFYVGVSAALFAAFAFSLNFVVPFIIGDYSTFDFALVRHVVSALVGLFILLAGQAAAWYFVLTPRPAAPPSPGHAAPSGP